MTMLSPSAHLSTQAVDDRPADLRWIATGVAVVIALQVLVALATGINWDEFYFYDAIRRLDAGTLSSVLQTFHTHLFSWLPGLPGDVTDHIRAARMIMLLCEVGAAAATFGLARRFASDTAAALVTLAYLSAGYVVPHGIAFRADPQAAVLLMGALWLLATRPLTAATIVLSGAAAGLAAMITIKVAIYAPAFAGIAWLRWHESRFSPRIAIRLVLFAVVALVVFAALYAWHSGFIPSRPASAGVASATSAGRFVMTAGLVPQWPTLRQQLLLAPLVTIFVALTVVFWIKLKLSLPQRFAIVGLLLPLASLVFYRNSFPYFYVFLLPPVLVATAPAVEQIVIRRYGVKLPVIYMTLLAAFLALYALPTKHRILLGQKQTIAVAHRLFPEPVTYFDSAGYLGDYDRGLSFLMSGWGFTGYLDGGVPQFARAMERKTIPLFIADREVLEAAVEGTDVPWTMPAEDTRAIRESYIHHWGRLWVAGRHVPAGDEALAVEIRVPGKYTLEDGDLQIDGILHRPGDVIELDRGTHQIAAPRARQATLRWGDHLQVPTQPAPDTLAYLPLRLVP